MGPGTVPSGEVSPGQERSPVLESGGGPLPGSDEPSPVGTDLCSPQIPTPGRQLSAVSHQGPVSQSRAFGQQGSTSPQLGLQTYFFLLKANRSSVSGSSS